MSKKYNKDPGFFFQKEIYESLAFRELKGSALMVYIGFLSRRILKKKDSGGYEITNNGEIVFSYRRAFKELGLSKDRFKAAIDQLIEKGFIDINHHGGGVMREATTYSISSRWTKYGTKDFIERKRDKGRKGTGFLKEKSNVIDLETRKNVS